MDKLDTIIIEDEIAAINLLESYISRRGELNLKCIAKNGKQALDNFKSSRFDLVFLDIDLPIISGIELIKSIDYPVNIIFTTALPDFAIEAFDIGAVDYLYKPFSEERFNKAVDKVVQKELNKSPDKNQNQGLGLSIKEKEVTFFLNFDEIIYLSSYQRYTVIHTEERSFQTLQLLKEMGNRLPKEYFIRIHKQYIINLKFLASWQYFLGGQYLVKLKDTDETNLPVGRKYAKILKKSEYIK